MEQLKLLILVVVLLAAIWDWREKRIPNWLVLSGFVFALALRLYSFGWQEALSEAGLGLAIATLLFFPLFLVQAMGAGDVKLLMVIGTALGPQLCLQVAIASICFGALYAIFDLIRRKRLVSFLKSLITFIQSLLIKGMPTLWPAIDQKQKFSFGIAMAVGFIFVAWGEAWLIA